MSKKTFDVWWEEIKIYAKRKCLSSLLGNKDSYREAYEDGLSPRKAFDEVADAAGAFIL